MFEVRALSGGAQFEAEDRGLKQVTHEEPFGTRHQAEHAIPPDGDAEERRRGDTTRLRIHVGVVAVAAVADSPARVRRDFENGEHTLKVNREKSKVAKPETRSFLSLKLWRLKSGKVYVLVADNALQRLERELKALTPRNWGQSIDDCIRRVNVFLRGWLGYFAVCDEKHLARLGRIDGHLRRRLRALILKQWKRKRLIVNHLMHLKVPAALARWDVHARRRSWWALSEVRAVCRALTNEYFERRGLFALHAHWRQNHERIWDIGPKQLALLEG